MKLSILYRGVFRYRLPKIRTKILLLFVWNLLCLFSYFQVYGGMDSKSSVVSGTLLRFSPGAAGPDDKVFLC